MKTLYYQITRISGCITATVYGERGYITSKDFNRIGLLFNDTLKQKHYDKAKNWAESQINMHLKNGGI